MAKNAEYDIHSLRPDFERDKKYGEDGEALISLFLGHITNGNFEVKSDRYRNGRMVIETNQNPKGMKNNKGEPVWFPSGINVTTATWWVYIFSPDGAFVIINIARLKKFLRANNETFNESTKINLGSSDNPARGFLLFEHHVRDLMTNPAYDVA
jgi:hypothetical protein